MRKQRNGNERRGGCGIDLKGGEVDVDENKKA